jgi:hypothetical protein
VNFYTPWSNMKILMLFHDFDVGATHIGNEPWTQKVRCSAFTIKLKYVISIILSYIYIVSIWVLILLHLLNVPMNYVQVFGWLLLVDLVVISASPTPARDTVEPIKHRLIFPSNKHFISFLTISFSFITYPIQMETCSNIRTYDFLWSVWSIFCDRSFFNT